MYGSGVSIKYISLIIAFAISSAVWGQIVITKPVLSFAFLCESTSVNTSHTITFSASPVGNINPGNIFSLEISNDNFVANSLPLAATVTQSGPVFTMTFSLPLTAFGPGYKLRVKGSSPVAISPNTDAFAAYFIKHNQEIFVNTPAGVDNVSFCSGGGSLSLFIYDSGTSSSPLFYPELTYVWKKRESSNDVVVGTGTSLNVTQPGKYFVETNYGICSSSFDSRSRIITVSSLAAGALTITSSSGNQICEGENITLSGSLTSPSNTYQWFKDGNPISGANASTYSTTTAGSYKLSTNNGICTTESNTLVLNSTTFSYSINQTTPISIYQGESATIVVTTAATNPIFKWYKDGTLLAETSNILQVSQVGTYKVIITQTTGCVQSKEVEILVQKPQIDEVPNVISPNNDGVNDKWILPSTITTQSDINVKIFNSSGKVVLSTDNYQGNWPTEESDYINSNAVFYYIISKGNSKIKQGTITIIK